VAKETQINKKADDTDVLDSEYPNHSESFEIYYYLGESRTLRETAAIRFSQLYPNRSEDDPKFESFYTKIKRWAKKENWKDWVKRKEMEERQKREEQMREKIIQSTRNVVGYRGMLQQGLVAFSRRVQKTVRLLTQISRLEEAASREPDPARIAEMNAEIRRLRAELMETGVEIRNFKEAKECIELDLYLARVLEQLPETRPLDTKLTEDEVEKVDRIMEWLRKHAAEALADSGNGDEK